MHNAKGFALIPMLVALQVLALVYIGVLEVWHLDSQALQQMQSYIQRQAHAKQCMEQAIAALPAHSSCLSAQRRIQLDPSIVEQYWELEMASPAMRVFVRCTADYTHKTILGWQTGGSLF